MLAWGYFKRDDAHEGLCQRAWGLQRKELKVNWWRMLELRRSCWWQAGPCGSCRAVFRGQQKDQEDRVTTKGFQQLLWLEETHTKDDQCQPNTTGQPFLSLPHFILPRANECKEEREGKDREIKKVINHTLLFLWRSYPAWYRYKLEDKRKFNLKF